MRFDTIRRRFVRQPLDWRRGAGRARTQRPSGVDVIIPIYGAAEPLSRCLDSVAAHTNLSQHRVLLVVDGADEQVDSLVAHFSARHPDAVLVLRNEHRLGFSGSVNRGVAASTSDVVLLNSDTIVTARWLEKLVDAAYSDGDVGTVTPLSNNAALCSVPRALEENLIPSGFDIDTFARLVEETSEHAYPRLPTGVGFCLYIRRGLLDDIGFFDSGAFPLGYGEENDFCMRASARGWLHIADDATFIHHAGHRSFGVSRHARQRSARAALARRHPRYMATIAEFMRLDPLAPVRMRIDSAVRNGQRKSNGLRIVHLVHGWPPFQHAGTELYAYWLVRRQRHSHDVSVYTRGADPSRDDGEAVEYLDESVRVRIVTNHFRARNPLRRNGIRDRLLERDFERFLRSEKPQLLHIHHLAGHTFSLVHVAKRLGIPIVLQIQDWWFLCARVNRFDRHGQRCSGPAAAKCARCATLTSVAPVPLTNAVMHALRRKAAAAAIRVCDAFVAGSNAIRDDYAGIVPRSKPFHVIPYGIAIEAAREKRATPVRPVRFGYVGSISPHKGVHVAVDAMRGIEPSDATLHIWGDAGALPDYTAEMTNGSGVVFEGRFREEEKGRTFASMDVLVVPSIGVESFGLAAREAMACGVPVIASSGGALSEMFAPGLCGEFFPPGDAAALRAVIRRIVESPDIIDRWREHLPTPKRDDVHAAEIEAVYRSVLAARPS